VSNHNGIVKLNTLFNKLFLRLQVKLMANFVHCIKKLAIIRFGKFNSREQITGDTQEERNIIRSELGNIDVVESAETNLALRPVKLTSQVTASIQNSLNSSHTEIVMVLR